MGKNMKIKVLIELLKKLNPEANVYISSDSEGNSIGTTEKTNIGLTDSGKSLIIYPFKEGLDYEDLK